MFNKKNKVKTWNELLETESADTAALSQEEKLRVEYTITDGESGTVFFANSANFKKILNQYWEQDIPPEAYYALIEARARLSDTYRHEPEILFSLAPPDWYVGFSSEFVKSIAKIDKNKRAKILIAIAELAEAPTTIHGDTIKPLTGNLSGLWRYRMGDDRMIYKVITSTNQIVLMSYGPRGEAYKS